MTTYFPFAADEKDFAAADRDLGSKNGSNSLSTLNPTPNRSSFDGDGGTDQIALAQIEWRQIRLSLERIERILRIP